MKSRNIKFNLQTPHIFPLDIIFKEIGWAGEERKALVIDMNGAEIILLKSSLSGKLFVDHYRMMDIYRNSNSGKVISLDKKDIDTQIIYLQLLGEIMDYAKELDWS